MNPNLSSPDKNAPTQDWLAWLEDLSEMPDSTSVRQAITEAHRNLDKRRRTEKKTPHGIHGHKSLSLIEA